MREGLSRNEWILMEAFWDKQPMFLSDVMDVLKDDLHWSRNTYQTYLKRLCDKGYISYKEVRGSYSYYPLATRETCVQQESRQMITKMKSDSAKLFLACMVQDSGLDKESKDSLKQLIENLSAEEAVKGGLE